MNQLLDRKIISNNLFILCLSKYLVNPRLFEKQKVLIIRSSITLLLEYQHTTTFSFPLDYNKRKRRLEAKRKRQGSKEEIYIRFKVHKAIENDNIILESLLCGHTLSGPTHWPLCSFYMLGESCFHCPTFSFTATIIYFFTIINFSYYSFLFFSSFPHINYYKNII